MVKPITTVFPATTVAATTTMLTGLNPCETAMLGWNMYYKGIDKIITTFIGCEKEEFEDSLLCGEWSTYSKEAGSDYQTVRNLR